MLFSSMILWSIVGKYLSTACMWEVEVSNHTKEDFSLIFFFFLRQNKHIEWSDIILKPASVVMKITPSVIERHMSGQKYRKLTGPSSCQFSYQEVITKHSSSDAPYFALLFFPNVCWKHKSKTGSYPRWSKTQLWTAHMTYESFNKAP